jgi:hypothetical protein
MAKRTRLISLLALLLVGTSTSAATKVSDDCAVLDLAFRQARTEFPALKNRQFGGALCSYRKNEFTCEWRFTSDGYGDALTQIDRLERCTAAEPNAALLEKKHQHATFQIDPDTKVLIGGPDADNGDWAIQLKITTTADWN